MLMMHRLNDITARQVRKEAPSYGVGWDSMLAQVLVHPDSVVGNEMLQLPDLPSPFSNSSVNDLKRNSFVSPATNTPAFYEMEPA